MNNLLSTAQSAAALFAQVTGAQLTTNFDFLPGEGRDGYEVQHFDSDTCGVECATAPADATVAQVLAAALSLRA